MSTILVTGAFGQIGSELVPALQEKYGKDQVIALGHHNIPADFDGIVEVGEILDEPFIRSIIEKHEIDTIYHMVSLLSASGEKDPSFTWKLNAGSLKMILDIAVERKIRVFWPSSIAAFGPTTPKIMTPQQTVLEPTTMYGVTKVSGELLCQYYHLKYGLDVRSVRYPGLISWKAHPGGGTSDYAVAIFYGAIESGSYDCFVKDTTSLPMMYMDDAVKATIDLMEADPQKLSIHTSYNLAAISFTVAELADEIRKHMPLEITYNPDHRQAIADSWPDSVDDSVARKDWGWQHAFDLAKMTEEMIEKLKIKLGKA